ncbi:MAG: T9SS type A sorting domain-containing protein [Bacteroidales bacterium]|nr:T9SS type A sorting domain-containing protein [Bacteroidales bacterium]
MKKYNLIFLFILLNYFAYTQNNLVLNYSFEIPTPIIGNCNCTPEIGAPQWRNPVSSSSDIFRRCYPSVDFQWPNNMFGFCFPRTDTSYAGLGLIQTTGIGFCAGYSYYREYLQGKLISKLETDKKYCISFYVSLADSSYYATGDIGVYFSNIKISDTGVTSHSECKNFPYIPQVVNDNGIITDTSNWVLIKGIYTAQGNELYLTIGNFAGDTIDTVKTGFIPKYMKHFAYYYMDDVSVVEITEANAGRDTIICNGDSVQLGTQGVAGVIYQWQTSEWLSDENVSNPIAKPTSTTKFYLTVTDSLTVCGTFVTTDSVTVTIAPEPCDIGVKELKVKCEKLKVYPNPASTEFIIESTNKNINNINVLFYDMLGKTVSTEIKRNNNKIIVNTRKLREGVYFYKIFEKEELLKTDKIVVIK